MNGSRRRKPGAVSLVFLLLLATGTLVLAALGRILWQQLINQKDRLAARQWAQLLTSCCSVRTDTPMDERQGSRLLASVKLGPEVPTLQVACSSVPLAGDLGWQETLWLETETGYKPMSATRYSLRMPGTDWTKLDLLPYAQLSAGPIPDGNRLAQPVKDYVYYTQLDKNTDVFKYAGSRKLIGRGLFVCQNPIILDKGFQLQGDFRIFCAKSVYIREDVVLDKVFLYSGGTINIGKNSQVKGILVAKNRVELGERASVIEDRSVLEPFQTLYL